MLGRNADHFMMSQMNERITAVPSNANGKSLNLPDQERAGTSRFVMPSTISPGPDNAINSGWVPGATSVQMPRTIVPSNEYRPGSEAVDEMGDPEDIRFASHLEGIGEDPIIGGQPAPAPVVVVPEPFWTKQKLMLAAAAAVGLYLLSKKRRK